MAAQGGILGGIARLIQGATGNGAGGGNNSPKASDGSELSDKISGWLGDKWTEIRNAYVIFHQSAWESVLFYVGESWATLDKISGTWSNSATGDDEWCPRPRINKFAPAIDSISSNFAHVPEVEADAVPADDYKTIGVADIANQLADYFIRENGLEADYKGEDDKGGQAAQMFVLMGNVFTLVYPQREKVGSKPKMAMQPKFNAQCLSCDRYDGGMNTPPTQCQWCQNSDPQTFRVGQNAESTPMTDPDTGEPMMDDIYRHHARVRVGNPLNCFPRPGSRTMADTPFTLWAERFTLDDINEHFGIDDADADAEFPDNFGSIYENTLNYYFIGFNSSTSQIKDSCLVIQAFVEPGKMKDFPDGFYAIWMNGKLKKFNTWAERFIDHPVTMAGYLRVPGVFFYRTPAFDLVQVQREKNAYEASIKLHAMTSACEPILQDENTAVSEITGRGDIVIKYRSIGPGSNPPSRLSHGTLDSGTYQQRDRLDQEFENIGGAVSVFKGEQPGSITAGNAISQLRGQAELMFSKPVTNWNNLWKETVRKGVKIYQRDMSIPEIVAIVGQDKMRQIKDFKSADLDKCIQWVATEHGLPRTRDERRQEIMALFDRGALDLNQVSVRQKVFELFGETGMMEQFNADATRARLENRAIEGGGQAAFMPEIEDLAVHFDIHSQAIKNLDFDDWNPQAKLVMIAHAMETKAAMQQLAMQQAMMEGAAPKPPSGPDKPAQGNPKGNNGQPAAPGGIPPAPRPTPAAGAAGPGKPNGGV